MITHSTLQHLRLPFSFFLMPIFWMALVWLPQVNWEKALIWAVILHLFIFPSSNGYNSLQDRDKGSIGGLLAPPAIKKDLFFVTLCLDLTACGLAFFLGPIAVLGTLVYITFSRLYSYRKVRIKKYPFWGYLVVVLNQGALIFYLTWNICATENLQPPYLLLIIATLFIAAFYPITQIYQHRQDEADGVKTWSMLLGIENTFRWCAILYGLAFSLLYYYLWCNNETVHALYLMVWFAPVIVLFFIWWGRSRKNIAEVNFHNTMKLNWVAAVAGNLSFATLLLIKHCG